MRSHQIYHTHHLGPDLDLDLDLGLGLDADRYLYQNRATIHGSQDISLHRHM